MIKSAKYGEEEAESSYCSKNYSLTLWEIFPIYKVWFAYLHLILGIKSLLPYRGLIFRETKDFEIGISADKYLFCVLSAFIYLFITNFPYEVGWPAGELKTLDGLP